MENAHRRKVRRLTKAEKAAIRLQYEAGARQVDLAEAFGVYQSTISRVVRREEAA
jgi:IS30 family transposase